MTETFTLKLVAESYKIKYDKVKKIAKKLGFDHRKVTDAEAFEIANYKNKPYVEIITVYKETLVMPSKANFLDLWELPEWPR